MMYFPVSVFPPAAQETESEENIPMYAQVNKKKTETKSVSKTKCDQKGNDKKPTGIVKNRKMEKGKNTELKKWI